VRAANQVSTHCLMLMENDDHLPEDALLQGYALSLFFSHASSPSVAFHRYHVTTNSPEAWCTVQHYAISVYKQTNYVTF